MLLTTESGQGRGYFNNLPVRGAGITRPVPWAAGNPVLLYERTSGQLWEF